MRWDTSLQRLAADILRSHGRKFCVSISEAADLLGVHPNTIRRHIADGTLPARRLGRRVFIVLDDLEAALTPVRPRSAVAEALAEEADR